MGAKLVYMLDSGQVLDPLKGGAQPCYTLVTSVGKFSRPFESTYLVGTL